MLAPLLMIGRVDTAEFAMTEANAFGLAYVDRSPGVTTGAWPGYQPFGEWKGSGSTWKALTFHYLRST
jgi:hypothetical protein